MDMISHILTESRSLFPPVIILSSLILLNCTSEVGSQSVKFLISSFSCQIVRYLTVQVIDFLISSLQAIDLISSLQAIDFLISSFSPAIDYLGAIDYY